MTRDYDPTVKALVDIEPASWLPLDNRPPAPVTVIDPHVSGVLSGAADKFLRVQANPDYILHLDFQSGHDSAQLAPRLRWYNASVDHKWGLPVRSVAVLLRPEADSPQLTGKLVRRLPGARPHAIFRYGVVRVWQLPTEPLLAGGLATLPLAPISNVGAGELPGVIGRMKNRLQGERRAKELWTATRVLLGLRYPQDTIDMVLQGVQGMKESVTYQAIVAEGLAEGIAKGLAKGIPQGMRTLLLVQGEAKFGPPDRRTRAAIKAIADPAQLEELGKRLVQVKSWQELLGQPTPRRRNGRRKAER